jgi:hypothetical protein
MFGGSMYKRIIDIGNARYRISLDDLSAMMEEAKDGAAEIRTQTSCPSNEGLREVDVAKVGVGDELEGVFSEVMRLYQEYTRSASMDVLVRLRCRLEEVSLRYRSFALAEEVLNINSCLPYERRVPAGNLAKDLDVLPTRH